LKYAYFAVYILLNIYIIIRTLRWFKNCHEAFELKRFRIPYIIVMSLMASLVIVAFYMQEKGNHHWLLKFSSQWFGVLFYIIFYVAMADLVGLILKLIKKGPKGHFARSRFVFRGGLLVIALIVATSIYGFIHVRDMKTTTYEVTIDKKVEGRDSLKIALVADQHLGYSIGVKDMQKMVEKINEAQPDIVCFSGDIFDNNFNALDDEKGIWEAFESIESTYGVYTCWGNHDVEEPLFSGFAVDNRSEAIRDPRMEEFLESAGFHLLEDKGMLINDEFYVVGRLDYQKAGDGTNNRKSIAELTKDMDKSKPIILLDHQPREFDEIEAAGVDLDLSGHTHAGQIFPMNLTNELTWKNGYGLMEIGNLTSIVTSGVGIYGPAMRTFTDSEVVIIDVTFK
jgi:Predicted phosphohydrolases